MTLLKAGIFFFIVWIAHHIQAKVSPDGENVCLETEIHQTTKVVLVPKQKTVKKKNWCWSISSNFKCEDTYTITVYENESRVVNTTKIVAKCCDGYREETVEVTKCAPACLKGCVNGKCISPEVCACNPGFYGANCENACPKDFWGENCSNQCNCSENGKCLPDSGKCICEPGWNGTRCELPCQDGYYGFLCEEKCECDNQLCNHITGQCVDLTTTTENSLENSFHSTEFTSTPYPVSVTELFEGSQTVEFEDEVTEQTEQIIGITDVPLTSAEENKYENETDFVKEKPEDSELEYDRSFFPILPTLSILSGFSFLLIITAAGWVIVKHQRKTKMMECAASQRDMMFQLEVKVQPHPDFFSITNCTKNYDYLLDSELKTTAPVLKTFKPVTENKST